MSGNDNHTYGFSKGDAEELVEMIGGGEGEYVEGRVRGGGGLKIFGFTLTNAGFVTTKTATADIFPLASAAFGTALEEDANIYDPAGWAIGATTGQTGLCVKQGGKYYAIQAGCPDDDPDGSSSE